jgi:hypothetical protein
LRIPKELEALVGERPNNRLEQLGKEIGEEVTINIE